MRFFTNEWNTRPVIGKEWFDKENHFVLLIERMIAGSSDYTSGGLRIDEASVNKSNPADLKFKIADENGRELYLRAAANPQARQSGSYQKALEEIIDRLSKIDEQNLPLTERIKAYGGVIEAFNVNGYTVFISPLEDVWNANLTTL